MLIATIPLGSVILVATTIAGMLMVYQIRHATDLESSAKAVFAADAGVECALEDTFKLNGCSMNYGQLPHTLSNGSSYRYTTSSVSLPNLAGWWMFDEGAGPTTMDSSGNGDDGVWNGSGPQHWTPGEVGPYAGEFNGVDDYVAVQGYNPAVLEPTRAVTVTAWVYPSTNSGYRAIVQKGTNYSGYFLRLNGGTLESFVAGNPNSLLAGDVPTNSWTFVAMTYDGSTLTNYIDGQLVQTASVSSPVSPVPTAAFMVDGATTGNFDTGQTITYSVLSNLPNTFFDVHYKFNGAEKTPLTNFSSTDAYGNWSYSQPLTSVSTGSYEDWLVFSNPPRTNSNHISFNVTTTPQIASTDPLDRQSRKRRRSSW